MSTALTRSGGRFAARRVLRLQRLDVGFDFDAGAELGGDRVFQPVRHVVGGAQRELAVDLQVERDRQSVLRCHAP